MSFDDIYINSYNSIIKIVNYLVNSDKRIFYLYLISSTILAYYVYYKTKEKVSFITYLFNKKVWLSKSARVDYGLIFINSFFKVFLLGSFAYYGLKLAFITDEYLSHTFGLSTNSMSKFEIILWFTLAITVVKDLTSYFTHFLQHKLPFLWEFHKIHHSATVLNPITQYRIHPFELVLNNITAILAFGLTTGFFDYLSFHQISEIEFLGANVFSFIFLFFGANLRHSHVKLKYLNWVENIFISPLQHQIHHSNNPIHFDKNLGAKLALWDWVFGTLIKSKSVKKLSFGLGNNQDVKYKSLLQNLYMPFLKIFKK
jgi:sterol desaturase/sphingolipid hydroxylase (fatty acid hydroxylase superfamily)